MTAIQPLLAELASVAAGCLDAADGAPTLSDDELLDAQRRLAGSQRSLEAAAARFAAETQHRSRRELGYDGLAQKRGLRTAEALVQEVTGSSSAAARKSVRVGSLAHGESEPWLSPALDAFRHGVLSADAVDGIRAGLGSPTATVTPDAFADAARSLTALAGTVTVERLAALARELRDTLDAAGVADREKERRDRRYLRLFPQADGMTRIVGLLDPESAAVVAGAVDAATSPRRGGARFVDEDGIARAERIVNDARSTEQLALDALVELVDVAVRGDSAHVLGSRRPSVRVLVTRRDLQQGEGPAHIEGQAASVSVATAERLACDGGTQEILFDSAGAVLDLGREHRLHSARQRKAITARDGGCLIEGCDRPPSWTEVHHIVPWAEGGSTDLADGVLLCRHHHLLVHNNGWRIRREGSEYWLYPPPGLRRESVLLTTKSPTVRRLLSA